MYRNFAVLLARKSFTFPSTPKTKLVILPGLGSRLPGESLLSVLVAPPGLYLPTEQGAGLSLNPVTPEPFLTMAPHPPTLPVPMLFELGFVGRAHSNFHCWDLT